jgi:galactokinase/mevalonate kinase-like predicted kinase
MRVRLQKDLRLMVASFKTSGENIAKASNDMKEVAEEMKQGKGLVPADQDDYKEFPKLLHRNWMRTWKRSNIIF